MVREEAEKDKIFSTYTRKSRKTKLVRKGKMVEEEDVLQ